MVVLAAIAAAAGIVSLLILLVILSRISKSKSDNSDILQVLREEILKSQKEASRDSADNIARSIHMVFERQDKRLDTLTVSLSDSMTKVDKQLQNFALQNEQKLDNIRNTVENRLKGLQEDNNKKLEQMRETVDEKLQKTLEERIGQSFKIVGDRLEQVYKGLGEMQKLATDVGDLKKVLSNVKTRGILGEVQLGAILEQILSPGQYETNVAVKRGAQERVEFAVKMPGDDNESVYLPIDAKFPLDAYEALLDAYDSADKDQISAATKILESRIKKAAQDIRDKYLDPPKTTDFAILFLPVEGLYAEVVRQRGLVETLQRSYNVSIAGPTTMAAILNSLQLGFQTLAIQRRSGEVWNVLKEVQKEFAKFAGVLEKAQNQIRLADKNLDELIGARTKKIRRQLHEVSNLPSEEIDAPLLIEDGEQ